VAPWTIVTSLWFAGQLKKYTDNFRLGLNKLKSAHWRSRELDGFLPLAEEFAEFRNELREVSPADPLSKLEYFCMDSNGQRYYRLGSGNWRAYYIIKEEEHSVVALTLLRRTSSREEILTELQLAIKEYRKDHG
jgi:hypothetical protein